MLRSIAVVIVVLGIRSSFALGIGAKLTMELSLEWWDFETSVNTYFLHCIAIAGMYIVLTYYTANVVTGKRRGAPLATSAA